MNNYNNPYFIIKIISKIHSNETVLACSSYRIIGIDERSCKLEFPGGFNFNTNSPYDNEFLIETSSLYIYTNSGFCVTEKHFL